MSTLASKINSRPRLRGWLRYLLPVTGLVIFGFLRDMGGILIPNLPTVFWVLLAALIALTILMSVFEVKIENWKTSRRMTRWLAIIGVMILALNLYLVAFYGWKWLGSDLIWALLGFGLILQGIRPTIQPEILEKERVQC